MASPPPQAGSIEAAQAAPTNKLTAAISNMIYAHGLSASLSESPFLQEVIKLARHVPVTYKPPHRRLVGGLLLDQAHATHMKGVTQQCIAIGKRFGLAVGCDGATIMRNPLINVVIMAPGIYSTLEIVDCTSAAADGVQKVRSHPLSHTLTRPRSPPTLLRTRRSSPGR